MVKSKTSEYTIWRGIRRRCHGDCPQENKYYKDRGIKVCDRWRSSFDDFLEDMGNKPSNRHQLDRINNDGDYEPGNVRWVLPQENQRNKPTTRASEKLIRVWMRLVVEMKWSQLEISQVFGFSSSAVWSALNGKTWNGSISTEEIAKCKEVFNTTRYKNLPSEYRGLREDRP